MAPGKTRCVKPIRLGGTRILKENDKVLLLDVESKEKLGAFTLYAAKVIDVWEIDRKTYICLHYVGYNGRSDVVLSTAQAAKYCYWFVSPAALIPLKGIRVDSVNVMSTKNLLPDKAKKEVYHKRSEFVALMKKHFALVKKQNTAQQSKKHINPNTSNSGQHLILRRISVVQNNALSVGATVCSSAVSLKGSQTHVNTIPVLIRRVEVDQVFSYKTPYTSLARSVLSAAAGRPQEFSYKTLGMDIDSSVPSELAGGPQAFSFKTLYTSLARSVLSEAAGRPKEFSFKTPRMYRSGAVSSKSAGRPQKSLCKTRNTRVTATNGKRVHHMKIRRSSSRPNYHALVSMRGILNGMKPSRLVRKRVPCNKSDDDDEPIVVFDSLVDEEIHSD